MAVSPGIKMFLGFEPDTEDEVVQKEWAKRTNNICKPCWELKYCPYGPLVEDFPLPPPTRASAIAHNEFLKAQLAKGAYDKERRKIFEETVRNFKPDAYPKQLSREELDWGCTVFGYLCPVVFVNEPFTETKNMRRIGRYIPSKIKMRIARRDNYTCQICGKHLKDDELEFDHIIPISKGGSSEEHNIRLACFDCNRRKSKKTEIQKM